jgi:acetyltransferase-like isoleucine patch superfamily enzyme
MFPPLPHEKHFLRCLQKIKHNQFCRSPRDKKDQTMTPPSGKPRARFEDPLSLVSRALTKLYTLWLSATYPFASRGRKLSIQYPCIVSRLTAHRIELGNSVIIRKDAWLSIITESNSELNLVIEDNCLIGARSVISTKNSIHLEHDVILATSVLIMDHNHAYEDIHLPIRLQGITAGGKIRIQHGCWIGQGAAIVCNEGELVIGHNSVIAANSLVTRSFPPYSVIIGNPGRLARYFDREKGAWTGGAQRVVPDEAAR